MPTLVRPGRRTSRRRRRSATRRCAASSAPGAVAAEPTFAEIAENYLERHIERYLVPRAAQLARYAHAYLATVTIPTPSGGSMPFTAKPFREITTADVEEAIERKAIPATKVRHRGAVRWTCKVGGGPTANRLHAHLRSLWRWAIVKGYCDATPFARAGLPMLRMRPEHARARRLTSEEAARLMAACGSHLRDLIIAALETGCRKQELLSLQWHQVDWARNELWLPGAKTKTKRPRRIPISAALYEVLLRRQRDPRGHIYEANACVFGTDTGARVRGYQDRVDQYVSPGRHSRPPVSRPAPRSGVSESGGRLSDACGLPVAWPYKPDDDGAIPQCRCRATPCPQRPTRPLRVECTSIAARRLPPVTTAGVGA